MKPVLFLLGVLLCVCVLDAGISYYSYGSRYDEMLDSKVPSTKLVTFTLMLNGVFNQVGPEINVTQPGLDGPLTLKFRPIDVPILKPAKTFQVFRILKAGTGQSIVAITEIDDLIYITSYVNLRISTEGNVSQGLFNEEDITDLTMDDLKKRGDCTTTFFQHGPLEFRGNWQPCQRNGPSLPNFQSRLTCTSLSVIGRREFQREGQLPSVCRNRRRIRI